MPPDIADATAAAPSDELYGPSYYSSHCGPVPYERNDHWLGFFGNVADQLARAFTPRRVFDAGCALGLLVECLWDRGVEARGRDISAWAIDQVRADVRPCCEVGSIADPIGGEYDLVTCIEVLEHMPEEAALQAIASMAAVAPRVLFSSSPTDFDEPTHCNVRPPAYWLARWAEAGFAPLTTHDAGYLAPHAYVLERSEEGRTPRDLAAFADRVRHRVALAQLGARMHGLEADLAAVGRDRTASDAARARLENEIAIAVARAAEAEEAVSRAQAEGNLALAAVEHHLQEAVSRAQAEGNRALDDAVARVKAEAEAELGRRVVEDRRLRAAAAQRAAEARTEAAEARAEAAEASARAAAAAAETASMYEQVAEAGRSMAAALDAARQDRSRAEAAERDTALLRGQVAEAQAARRATAAERDRLLASTTWRVTWPLRASARVVPVPVRRYARRGLSAAWWMATGQFGPRLRRRREIFRDARAVAETPLFDAGWYAARNPDVGASGLDPALHYVTVGAPEGRDPGPDFSVGRYLERHPEVAASGRPALLHFLEHGQSNSLTPEAGLPEIQEPITEVVPPQPATLDTALDAVTPSPPPDDEPSAQPQLPPLGALLRERFAPLEPLRTYAAPHDIPRVTIVTDSINAGSLYGGVGTALVLAVLLARRLGAGLRLVTRYEPPDDADSIGAVLAVHGISWNGNVDLVHAPPGPGGRDVPVGPRDVVLTTSWWTTWATRRSVPPARIAYLLQEDERGFYPLGDDHLRATEMLGDPNLLYIVNSELLMSHLRAEGLAPGGVAFEPAFNSTSYRPEERKAGEPRNFFFYARPNNLRNLYWRGLEAIGAAVEEGVLKPDEWAFHFVGKGAHDLMLPRGVRPHVVHNLPWADYAGLVRRMDLGLSLMDTPHPSYPPLDLAASGAVVVTNRFGSKISLEAYSPNILCVEPTVPGLVEGLRRAAALAVDSPTRAGNFARNGLQRDWEVTLAPALDRLAARFGG